MTMNRQACGTTRADEIQGKNTDKYLRYFVPKTETLVIKDVLLVSLKIVAHDEMKLK